jgi:hypothetical protein
VSWLSTGRGTSRPRYARRAQRCRAREPEGTDVTVSVTGRALVLLQPMDSKLRGTGFLVSVGQLKATSI